MGIALAPSSVLATTGSGSLVVLEPGTLTPIGRCAVGSHPGPLAIHEARHRAYVIDHDRTAGGGVTVVDLESLHKTTSVTIGGRLGDVAVDVAADRVYVSDARAGTLRVIDATNDTQLPSIAVGDRRLGPSAVVASPATGTLFVAIGLPGIAIVDGRTGTIEEVIPTPDAGAAPRHLTLLPATRSASARLGVATVDGIAILTLDRRRTTVSVSTPSAVVAVAVDAPVGLIYAATVGHGVYAIDAEDGSIAARHDTAPTAHGGLAVAGDGTVYLQVGPGGRVLAMRPAGPRPTPAVGPLRLAVSTAGGGVHLFRQTTGGSVETAARPAGRRWSRWTTVGHCVPGAPMAVVPGGPTGWSVLGVDADGSLRGPSTPMSARFPVGAHIAATIDRDRTLRMYAVDVDGLVRGLEVAPDGLSHETEHPGAVFGPGAPLVVVGRHLFAVHADGTVWVGSNRTWVSAGAAGSAPVPGSPVTAVGRPRRVDLLFTGLDGQVVHGFRSDDRDRRWRWGVVTGWLFPRRTRVAAVDRGDGALHVFAVDFEGTVWAARHRGADDWSGWERVEDASGHVDGTVLAAGRPDGAIDLLWLDDDGGIVGARYGNGASADRSSRLEVMPSFR